MLPATPLSIIRAVIYNVKTMVNGRGTFRNSAKPVDARLQGILDVIHQLSVSPSETQEKSTAVLKTMSIVTNAREFLESLPAHLDHEALWVDKIAVWKANSERFYDLNKRLSDHLDSLSSLFPNSPPELTQGHCKSDWWTIALKDLHDEVDRALSRLLSDVLSGDDLPAELEDLLHAIETLPTVIAPICIEFAVVDVAVQELLAFVQRTAQEIRTRHSNSTEQLTPSSYADASYASPIAISRLSPTRDRMSPFSSVSLAGSGPGSGSSRKERRGAMELWLCTHGGDCFTLEDASEYAEAFQKAGYNTMGMLADGLAEGEQGVQELEGLIALRPHRRVLVAALVDAGLLPADSLVASRYGIRTIGSTAEEVEPSASDNVIASIAFEEGHQQAREMVQETPALVQAERSPLCVDAIDAETVGTPSESRIEEEQTVAVAASETLTSARDAGDAGEAAAEVAVEVEREATKLLEHIEDVEPATAMAKETPAVTEVLREAATADQQAAQMEVEVDGADVEADDAIEAQVPSDAVQVVETVVEESSVEAEEEAVIESAEKGKVTAVPEGGGVRTVSDEEVAVDGSDPAAGGAEALVLRDPTASKATIEEKSMDSTAECDAQEEAKDTAVTVVERQIESTDNNEEAVVVLEAVEEVVRSEESSAMEEEKEKEQASIASEKPSVAADRGTEIGVVEETTQTIPAPDGGTDRSAVVDSVVGAMHPLDGPTTAQSAGSVASVEATPTADLDEEKENGRLPVAETTEPPLSARPAATEYASTSGERTTVHKSEATAADGKAFLRAAERDDVDAITGILMEKRLRVNAVRDENQQTGLHRAAFSGATSALRLLLRLGADVRAVSSTGQTPLHRAAAGGHAVVVTLLIAAGADLHARDKDEASALHLAAEFGHDAAARELLQGGADPAARNRFQKTALHAAAERGHTPVLRILVNTDLDVNVRDMYQRSALFCAAYAGHVDSVKFLLSAGADASISDLNGSTVWDAAGKDAHASKERRKEVQAVLRDHKRSTGKSWRLWW